MQAFFTRFFCRAGSIKHAGRLNIYGAPTARDFPVDLKAVEGQEFVLHCPVGGYPLEKVSWDKDRTAISPADLRRKAFNNGTLIIHRVVKESDEGTYKCTALSRNGQKASVGTRLRVIGKQTADMPVLSEMTSEARRK